MPTSPVPASGGAATKKSHALLALLLVVAATLAVYLPTPGNYWIRYDNEALIRNSPQVNALAGDDKLSALVTMFTHPHYSLYQPLFTLSVALDHAIFGWDIAGFHAHSVLLHVVVVALLLFVLFRLTGSWLAATATTLLVAVHPALVETVRWAICRNSEVAALWLLVGVLLYLHYVDRPGQAALWGSQVAFGLSMLGKVSPAMVAIPFALDLWRHRRIDRRAMLEKVPLLALSVLLTIVNYRATLAYSIDSPLQRPWREVLGFLPESVALMTANALAPANLAILYSPTATGDLLGWRWILVLVAVVAGLGGGAWAWRRGERGVLLGLAVGFLLLLPNIAAGRFRVSIAADRYIYLPILFLAAALAAAVAPMLRARVEPELPGAFRQTGRVWVRWITAAVLIAASMPLALAARVEARRWEDEHRIWQRVNELAPHYKSYFMLGNLAAQEEKWPDAAALYSRALDLAQADPYAKRDPAYSSAYVQANRKVASELEKQPPSEAQQQERAALLERASEVAAEAAAALPANADLQFQLGKTYYKQQNHAEAVATFDAAIAVDPLHYQAWTYKAMSQYRLGKKEDAIASFRRSLAIHPYWMTYSNLSKVQAAEGKFTEAATVLQDWLKLEPKSEEAHKRFLQTVAEMLRRGTVDPAVTQLESYLLSFPDSAPARTMLEAAQARRSRP